MYKHIIFNTDLSNLIVEENNAPADLSKKIVFRKTKAAETDSETAVTDKPVKKKAKKEKQKAILSFDDDDEDDVG